MRDALLVHEMYASTLLYESEQLWERGEKEYAQLTAIQAVAKALIELGEIIHDTSRR